MVKEKNSTKKTSTILKVIANLAIMLGIVAILGWVALIWMDSWTLHSNVKIVPNVKGLSYNQAVDRLTDEGLNIELSDSLYDSSVAPGTVIEQNPKSNCKVKPGRVVYVTINAFSPRMVTLPQLTDRSLRTARSILESAGIKNITEVPVMSEFKDLVLGVKCNGRKLQPGARVAINSAITLEVGDGLPGLMDTIKVENTNSGSASTVEMLNLN